MRVESLNLEFIAVFPRDQIKLRKCFLPKHIIWIVLLSVNLMNQRLQGSMLFIFI